jgi:hypothetical protein
VYSAIAHPDRGIRRPFSCLHEVGYVFARTISANRVPEFNPNDTIMMSAGATF